jgi:hypothetical protein
MNHMVFKLICIMNGVKRYLGNFFGRYPQINYGTAVKELLFWTKIDLFGPLISNFGTYYAFVFARLKVPLQKILRHLRNCQKSYLMVASIHRYFDLILNLKMGFSILFKGKPYQIQILKYNEMNLWIL